MLSLMWPFKIRPVAIPVPDVLARDALNDHDKRLDLLGDRMAALERRFTKLQGEVSREWRDRYERADVEYDDEEDASG